MAFDPDAYLAAKKPAEPSGFDPDAYLAAKKAPPVVDMGPEARRARAGMPAVPHQTAEEAGTMSGPLSLPVTPVIGTDVNRYRPQMERAAASPAEVANFPDADARARGDMVKFLLSTSAGGVAGRAVGGAVAPKLAPLLEGAAAGGAGSATATALEGGSTADVLEAGGRGAALGAALGVAPQVIGKGLDVAGKVASKVLPSTEKAIKNARGWVVHDIAGDIKGASTATARKQLADDADNASMLVLKDKPLDKAVSRAQSGNLEELNTAQALVQDRLDDVATLRLAPHWDKATQALPGGGVRSGDVVDFLRARSGALKATGKTSEAAEAQALDAIRARVEGAKDWGGGAGKFNPNVIVPAKQVQGLWSDEAGIAYKSMGGIHGTVAFERKLDVASHLRDFRDDMLAKAAKVDPRTVGEIRAANRDYSALKRIENVLDQRINNAKASAGGASIPRGLKRKVAEFKQSPTGFVLGAIPDTLMAGKAGFDKWLARKAIREPQQLQAVRNIWESPGATGIRTAVAAGVPASVAMWAARAANQGVEIQDDRLDLP